MKHMSLSLLTVKAKNEVLRRVLAVDSCSSTGRPRCMSAVQTLERVLFVCRTGCQWSQLPMENGHSYKTVHHRFMVWSRHRVFEDAFRNLARQYVEESRRLPLIADTTFVKNVFGKEVLGRNHTDRGRRAIKVSLLSDAAGVPLATAYHMPNTHDCKTLRHLLDTARRTLAAPLSRHQRIYADKGYDSQTCRSACEVHGLEACIPHRGSRDGWGSTRYVVEVVFGRLDRFRRIILRYDATMHAFRSFHSLACCAMIR